MAGKFFSWKIRTPFLIALAASLVLLMVVGCDNVTTRNTDEKISAQQEQMQSQALAQTGLPGITNFTELKLVKHLYELRDQKIVTYSYVPDMNGKLWHLCDSIGYGLPYGVQYSNPQRRVFYTPTNAAHSDYDLPQAEPNGLFMPASAEGTWITCVDPNGNGQIQPVYVEPRVIVSPFKLRAEGEYAVK
jgi:hypothetical protein